jgi:hypothetical protein
MSDHHESSGVDSESLSEKSVFQWTVAGPEGDVVASFESHGLSHNNQAVVTHFFTAVGLHTVTVTTKSTVNAPGADIAGDVAGDGVDSDRSLSASSSSSLSSSSPSSSSASASSLHGTAAGTVVAVAQVHCLYVKREVRSLTLEDREAFLNAMHTLWKVPTLQGRDKYGPEYTGSDVFVSVHADQVISDGGSFSGSGLMVGEGGDQGSR